MATWMWVLAIGIALMVAWELLPQKRVVYEVDTSDRLSRVIAMLMSQGLATAWLHCRDQEGGHGIQVRRDTYGNVGIQLGGGWTDRDRQAAEDAMQRAVGDWQELIGDAKQVERAMRAAIESVRHEGLQFEVSLEGPYNYLSGAKSSFRELRQLLNQRK